MKTISETDLRDILHVTKETTTGQLVADCPFCGKESHFYIDKHTQLFSCKKCWEGGNIYKLLRFLDKTYLLDGATIEVRDEISSLRTQIQEKKEQETKLQLLPEIKLPVGFKVLEHSNKYLINRYVTADICCRYKIGSTALVKRFDNYVIIPVYDNGKVRGYLGRYGAKQVPDDKLRYQNSRNTDFGALLYGYDEITDYTRTVILVEGVFDKISVDRHLSLWDDESIKCVATFGKKISKEQQQKLLDRKIVNIILLYDYDAIKEIKKYGLLLEQNFVTSITFTNKKDIDECTHAEALEVFNNLRKPHEFNIDVIGKLKRK